MNIGAVRMAKTGRPRRPGERYPNGRLRDEAPDRLMRWNKARENFMLTGSDPRLATQRGKLFCMRQLSELEFDAANRWADLLDGWDRIVLGASRSPRPPALERSSPGVSHDEDTEADARFRQRFAAAHAAVLTAGKTAEAALNKLCRDEASSAVLPDAQRALAALVAHFAGKGRRK